MGSRSCPETRKKRKKLIKKQNLFNLLLAFNQIMDFGDFNQQESGLEDAVHSEESNEKMISYFEQSKAWQEHKKKHKDAKLQMVEKGEAMFQKEQAEGLLRRDHEEEGKDKKPEQKEEWSEDSHEKEHKSMQAGCGCGKFDLRFNPDKRVAYSISGDEETEEKMYGKPPSEEGDGGGMYGSNDEQIYSNPSTPEGGSDSSSMYGRRSGAEGSDLYK